MALLLLTGLLAAQSISTPAPLATPRGPARRPVLATLEGTAGAASAGLFDLRSGSFVPARLDPALRAWTHLEPAAIDFAGRSQMTSGLAGAPQLRTDVGLGSRIVLPQDRGAVWMLRGERAGQPGFAIVHVSADGSPRLLLEQDALGLGQCPFLPKIGIDPGATGLAVATLPAAGGDLFEVDVDSGTVELRSGHLPPLDFGVDGVWLGEVWGFGVAPDGPYRFLRRPGARAARVETEGVPPGTWRGDASMNPVCGSAVAVAGSAPGAWQPFVFGPTGRARVASAAPQNMRPAGFEPEVSTGPFLAICNDAITVGWCVEDVDQALMPFTDVFLGRAQAVASTVVASGDSQMIDTVNEIGRVIPSPVGGVLFAVGEPNDPLEGGLEGAEVLAAGIDGAGNLTLQNLSRTSTDTVLPLFTSSLPTLTPARFVFLNEEFALIHEDDSKQLLRLSLVSGQTTTILDAVREVYWIETAGAAGGWVAAIERDDAARRQQIIGASSASHAASILDPGSPSAEFLSPVVHRPGAAVAYVRRDGGLEFLDVVDVAALQVHRWSQTPGAFTAPLAFVGRGALVFTRGAGAAGGEQWLWRFRTAGLGSVISGLVRPSMILR